MNRRELLFGRNVVDAAPTKRELPRVISWLDESVRELSSEAGDLSRPRNLPLLRPPGAVRESDFLEACTRCGDCLTACPHGVLELLPERYGSAAGTPVLDPARSPCLLCDGLPCAQACGAGALDAALGGRIGTARLQPFDCLNALGATCSVCVERCPVPGAIVSGSRGPVINESLCVGCGLCHFVCPAPVNAIAILPSDKRPARTAQKEMP